MKTLRVDQTKLITQAEYARKVGKTRAWVNQQVKAGILKSITIQGAVLVYQD